MEYLAVLGRQPEISVAELRAQFENVVQKTAEIALFDAPETPNLARLGGSLKLAQKPPENISPEAYLLTLPEGKITLGLSDYSKTGKKYASRDIKNISQYGIKIKQALKKQGRSVRLLPNSAPVISTAAAHHNGLGEKPRAVELIKFDNAWYASLGVQNITAYTARDQKRPARDAKVGMLPPKLAQILINLCGKLPENATVLDPFCGTGVVLQEAILMGYNAYGTDKDERMVSYARRNLDWLLEQNLKGSADNASLSVGDATSYLWNDAPISAVASEIYLGVPLSTPPPELKLKALKQECEAILLGFLKNLAKQLPPDTPVTLAIPAWKRLNGSFERLNLVDKIESLGYNVINMGEDGLLYARENQVVAREIIVLRKK